LARHREIYTADGALGQNSSRLKHPNHLEIPQLTQFEDHEFDVATATTVEEAKEVLKLGFEYVTEKNGIMLFRRPKRLGSLGVTNENRALLL